MTKEEKEQQIKRLNAYKDQIMRLLSGDTEGSREDDDGE